MGLRKPAVKSLLKHAERKTKEGKKGKADRIAERAGRRAGANDREVIIDKQRQSGRISDDVAATAGQAALNEAIRRGKKANGDTL